MMSYVGGGGIGIATTNNSVSSSIGSIRNFGSVLRGGVSGA